MDTSEQYEMMCKKGGFTTAPTLDQLVDIATDGLSGGEAIEALYEWCYPFHQLGTMPHPADIRCAMEQENYIKRFGTLHQLVLAYVMASRGYRWDGENWGLEGQGKAF